MQDIEIKGYIPSSLLDYPGKICSVIFLPDCNFRCPFCQNPDLITKPDKIPNIMPEKIFEHLKSRRKWLDGVCITGGEPTLHAGLPSFLSEIKKLFRNKIIKENKNLIEITLKSPKEIETTAGVVPYVYSLFGEHGINIVETMSCWTDTLFVIEEKDIAKAMDILRF